MCMNQCFIAAITTALQKYKNMLEYNKYIMIKCFTLKMFQVSLHFL